MAPDVHRRAFDQGKVQATSVRVVVSDCHGGSLGFPRSHARVAATLFPEMQKPNVVEVTDQDFAQEVVEGSRVRPVVVDLWAEWCAPCRQLGPILEGLAKEKAGAFLLAKVDVDSNPVTAQQLNAMSIPAVKAFRGGDLVDEFTGALPEHVVRPWIEALLPSEADELAADAAVLLEGGDATGAETTYRKALSVDATNRDALVGLGRVLADVGSDKEAREVLNRALPDPEAEAILTAIRVKGWASDVGSDPLTQARHLAAGGRWREALDGMLALLPQEPEAREAILDVFAVLGEDQLVREYRPKLAAALF